MVHQWRVAVLNVISWSHFKGTNFHEDVIYIYIILYCVFTLGLLNPSFGIITLYLVHTRVTMCHHITIMVYCKQAIYLNFLSTFSKFYKDVCYELFILISKEIIPLYRDGNIFNILKIYIMLCLIYELKLWDSIQM